MAGDNSLLKVSKVSYTENTFLNHNMVQISLLYCLSSVQYCNVNCRQGKLEKTYSRANVPFDKAASYTDFKVKK